MNTGGSAFLSGAAANNTRTWGISLRSVTMYSTMPSCNYHASDNANGLERWKHDTTWMNDGLKKM